MLSNGARVEAPTVRSQASCRLHTAAPACAAVGPRHRARPARRRAATLPAARAGRPHPGLGHSPKIRVSGRAHSETILVFRQTFMAAASWKMKRPASLLAFGWPGREPPTPLGGQEGAAGLFSAVEGHESPSAGPVSKSSGHGRSALALLRTPSRAACLAQRLCSGASRIRQARRREPPREGSRRQQAARACQIAPNRAAGRQ